MTNYSAIKMAFCSSCEILSVVNSSKSNGFLTTSKNVCLASLSACRVTRESRCILDHKVSG